MRLRGWSSVMITYACDPKGKERAEQQQQSFQTIEYHYTVVESMELPVSADTCTILIRGGRRYSSPTSNCTFRRDLKRRSKPLGRFMYLADYGGRHLQRGRS